MGQTKAFANVEIAFRKFFTLCILNICLIEIRFKTTFAMTSIRISSESISFLQLRQVERENEPSIFGFLTR